MMRQVRYVSGVTNELNMSREHIAPPDDAEAWTPPKRNIKATCYLKKESCQIVAPGSPTAHVEADLYLDLEDMR